MVPGAKERPVQEFLNALLFRPLAHLVVLLLLRTPVRPHHLVLFHTGLVLGAAWLLLRGRTSGPPSSSSSKPSWTTPTGSSPALGER